MDGVPKSLPRYLLTLPALPTRCRSRLLVSVHLSGARPVSEGRFRYRYRLRLSHKSIVATSPESPTRERPF
jgi:hypothetical protein